GGDGCGADSGGGRVQGDAAAAGQRQPRVRPDRVRQGKRQRGTRARAWFPRAQRWADHESGTADGGRQGGGARLCGGLGAGDAAAKYRGGWRGGIRRAQDGNDAVGRGRVPHGVRLRSGGKAGVRAERRTPDRYAEGLGAVSAGSGARSVSEFVREPQDAGAHAVHGEEWEGPEKLRM